MSGHRVRPGGQDTAVFTVGGSRQDYTLEQAKHLLQRKDEGLTQVSSRRANAILNMAEVRREQMINFIQKKFHGKECMKFVPKADPKRRSTDPPKCHCGEVESKHYLSKSPLSVSGNYQSQVWKENNIQLIGTPSFGKIEFINEESGGSKPVKYVRVCDEDSVDDLVELMELHWNMLAGNRANLVITIIGGAKNFKLDGRRKETFNTGLIKAAQTTHAWLITGGCNMGVMKAVGEAVQEGQSYNWDKEGMTHSLRCVGIAPWGYIERREDLTRSDQQGCFNAYYKANSNIRHGHPVSINPDHTHFIFVDDGKRGRYGGVAELRAALERKISQPKKDGGLGIPLVLVVVEGGSDAIKDVHKSVQQHTPVVLCDGTGRAADILAYAYRNHITRKGERKIREENVKVIEDMLYDAYSKSMRNVNVDDEIENLLKIVLQCCEDEKLITVFNMDKNEDLDLAILTSLLKGQGAINQEQLIDQLQLALTWNRSDIAEDKIFTDEVNWPTGRLDDIMTRALKENQLDFVKLLLRNGVVMKEYLTVKRLRDLYNDPPKTSPVKVMLSSVAPKATDYNLSHVRRLLKRLKLKHEVEAYKKDTDLLLNEDMELHTSLPYKRFQKPFQELLIWAVLMNRQKMALFLWERGDEAIPSALAASALYGQMANRLNHTDSDLSESYTKHKEEFEMLAVNVVDSCYNADPEKAAKVVERRYPSWGQSTCLEMAAAADARKFVSTTCAQNCLHAMWSRGLVARWFLLPFAILLPFFVFVPFVIRFPVIGEGFRGPSCWDRLLTFYRTPMVKFTANTISYLIFLALYSYMLLFDFRTTAPSIIEWLCLAWIGTMLCDEIRQIFDSRRESMKDRVMDWWAKGLNRVDMLGLSLAIIAFALRLKVLYCITCVFFYVIFLRTYSASSYLGPKLIMIRRMFTELIMFIAILVVALLAYGVTSQSLMFPSREPYIGIFKDIFYYPYWQTYGELFLEDITGQASGCNKANSTVSDTGEPCPQYSWLVLLLLAGYLLMGNVLLLNLLIAIFSHVFEEVQENSIEHWKFSMYYLVMEFRDKPVFAPPLIIFELIYKFLRWLCKQTCLKKDSLGEELSDSKKAMLSVFEKEKQTFYLRQREKKGQVSIEKRVAMMRTRVDEIARILEDDMLHRKHQRELQEKEEKKKERPSLTPRRQASQAKFNLAAVKEANATTDQDTGDVTKRVGTLVKRSSLAQLPVTEETEAVHVGKDQQVPNIPPRSIGGKSLLTIAGDNIADDHSTKMFGEKMNSMKSPPLLEGIEEDETQETELKTTKTAETGSIGEPSKQNTIPKPQSIPESRPSYEGQGHQPNIFTDHMTGEARSPQTLTPLPSRDNSRLSDPWTPSPALNNTNDAKLESDEERRRRRKERKKKKKKRQKDAEDGNFSEGEDTAYKSRASRHDNHYGVKRTPYSGQRSHWHAAENYYSDQEYEPVDPWANDEEKLLNTDHPAVVEVTERMSSMEDRLTKLEQTTTRSLGNIEQMLKNAIFRQSVHTGQSPSIRTNTVTGGPYGFNSIH